MTIIYRRLAVIGLSGLAGSAAVGILAPNMTVLLIGILMLGIGLVLAIQLYLLSPLPAAPILQPVEWPDLSAVVLQSRMLPLSSMASPGRQLRLVIDNTGAQQADH